MLLCSFPVLFLFFLPIVFATWFPRRGFLTSAWAHIHALTCDCGEFHADIALCGCGGSWAVLTERFPLLIRAVSSEVRLLQLLWPCPREAAEKPAAEVPPFGMLLVSVKAQFNKAQNKEVYSLLTVNKQLGEREDAEPGSKPEGLLPQGNTTLFWWNLKERLWRVFGNQYSQTSVTQYRFSSVRTNQQTPSQTLPCSPPLWRCALCSLWHPDLWEPQTHPGGPLGLCAGGLLGQGWEAVLFFVLWQNSPGLLKFMVGRHQKSISFPWAACSVNC